MLNRLSAFYEENRHEETKSGKETRDIMKQICSDLEEEYQEFDDLVSRLDEKQWLRKTPFFQWTIFDEVAHIAFFDHEALLAIEDLGRFK
jgi:hypothetical protein